MNLKALNWHVETNAATEEPKSMSSAPPIISPRRKIMFGLLTVALFLVFGEITARVYLDLRGVPMDPRSRLPWYRSREWSEEFWREAGLQSTRYESYVGWRRKDFEGRWIHVRNGERFTTHPANVTDEAPEVWCFGGSTLWGTGSRDAHTIPSCLAAMAAETGRPLRVRNFGETGWVSTQEMVYLTLKCRLGLPPDLVIFYDGVNDTYSALQNGRGDGVHQNLAFWESYLERGIDPRKEWYRRLGVVRAGTSLLRRVGLGNEQKFQAEPETLNPSRPDSSRDEGAVLDGPSSNTGLAEKTAATYLGNVEFIRRLGADYGFETLFFWQPIVYAQPSYETAESQVRGSFDPIYFDFHRRVSDMVLSSPHPPVDLRGCLGPSPDTGYFIDHNHVTEDGNAVVARAILANLPVSIHTGEVIADP